MPIASARSPADCLDSMTSGIVRRGSATAGGADHYAAEDVPDAMPIGGLGNGDERDPVRKDPQDHRKTPDNKSSGSASSTAPICWIVQRYRFGRHRCAVQLLPPRPRAHAQHGTRRSRRAAADVRARLQQGLGAGDWDDTSGSRCATDQPPRLKRSLTSARAVALASAPHSTLTPASSPCKHVLRVFVIFVVCIIPIDSRRPTR